MDSKWFPAALNAAAITFSAATLIYHYDRLPERLATHFDAQGQADGWSTKRQFVAYCAATLALVSVTLIPLCLLASYAPAELINLPNKDYWMSPEREAETRGSIVRWGLWFFAATLWLLALIIHEALAANFRQPPQMRWHWWLLGGYLVSLGFLLTRLLRFFRRPQ